MPEHSLSPDDFRKLLQEELRSICDEYHWKYDAPQGRGHALQLWAARLFCKADPGIESDPEAAFLRSDDLGADVVLEDPNQQLFTVLQCKHVGLTKHAPSIKEGEVNDFFNRHKLWMERNWIRNHAKDEAWQLLGDYRDRIDKGWSAEYFFVSTGIASGRVADIAQITTSSYAKESVLVRCHLLDQTGLRNFYSRVQSEEDAVIERIELDFPAHSYFEKTNPYKTLIGVVKGNALRALYNNRKYGEALFNHNIRGFLGRSRTINRTMIDSALNSPDEFFYLNNGVSAVCKRYELKKNKIIAEGFQIINGAQTVGALSAAEDRPDLYILFRLTESDRGSLNDRIIRFNNSQNAIKLSDFRANDPIQRWLEAEFAKLTASGPLPVVRYAAKRSGRKKIGAYVIHLEELAKIRYAFFSEPTLLYNLPKELWTPKSDGGRYEDAFGIDGELVDRWTNDVLTEALLAIAFYYRIEKETTADLKANPVLWYPKRLRYHLLSLAGIYVRGTPLPASQRELLKDAEKFEKAWEAFWPEATRTLNFVYDTATEDEQMTLTAFARNGTKWESMKRAFAKNLALTSSRPSRPKQ